MPWEVERDRFKVMFSGPLEVGECIPVVPASFTDSDVERVAEALRAVDWYDPAAWQLAARAALTAYLEPTTKGDT